MRTLVFQILLLLSVVASAFHRQPRGALQQSQHRRFALWAAEEQAEAVELFRAKYSAAPVALPAIFSRTVARENSIAGQDLYQGEKKGASAAKPPLNQVTDAQLGATFNTIASLYGGEARALNMVKAAPVVLSRDPSMFTATKEAFLAAFDGKYTERQVEDMVIRNPNLLSLRPTGYGGADKSGDETMFMSYVVAVTRPAGPVLLAATAIGLLTPVLKKLAGIE